MDPLSITAAGASFVAIVAATAKQVHNIISTVKHMPDDILALHNELMDLNLTLDAIESVRVTEEMSGADVDLAGISTHSIHFQLALRTQLTRATDLANQLRTLLGDVFQEVNGRPRYSKHKWLKRKSESLLLHRGLKQVKESLTFLFSSLTAARTTRIEVSLEKLSKRSQLDNIALDNISDASSTLQQSQEVSLGSRSSEGTGLASRYGEHGTLLEQVRQIGQFAVMSFHVHRLSKCRGVCECSCHQRHLFRSPSMLDKIFGALFIGYAGLPMTQTRCSVDSCENQYARIAQFSYTFPAWFLSKTVETVVALTYMNEPSFGLKVRNRRSRSASNDIFHLARQGDVQGIIQMFKSRQASVIDVSAAAGQSLLHFALELGHIETCRFLLDSGLDPHAKTDNGYSDALEISSLVLSGRTGSHRTSHDYDSLFRKFSSTHSELWEFPYLHQIITGEISVDLASALVTHSSEIDAVDVEGRTALWWAALRGDFSKVKLLLEVQADHRKADREGRIALHSAIQSGNFQCIELLLIAGSNVQHQDMYGDSAINFATWANDNPQILRLLARAGAPTALRNHHGVSLLASAACLNHYRNAGFLIDFGVDLDSCDNDNDTPISEAIRYSNLQMVELLLDSGARTDWVNNSGHTLMHVAAICANDACFDLLSKYSLHRSMLQCRDVSGATPEEAYQKRIARGSAMDAAFGRLIDSMLDEDGFYDAVERL